jgi:hypothetical protein
MTGMETTRFGQQTLDYLAPAMEGDAFDRAFTEATRLLARVG